MEENKRSRKKEKGTCADGSAVNPGVCFEPLEPRLLLSGSWGAGVDAPSHDSQTSTHGGFTQETVVVSEITIGSEADTQHQNPRQTAVHVDLLAQAPVLNAVNVADPVLEAPSTSNEAAPATGDTPTNSTESDSDMQPDRVAAAGVRELVFVNENIAGYQQLIADLQGDDNRIIEVAVLDADRDGIEQVSEILADRSDLAAVHFVTHGTEGQIGLGNTWLNSETLQQNSAAVTGWGDALSETGDILFYGCNIADGRGGQLLLNEIADLTGADVAASDDPTGSARLGGDWDLEYVTDTVEASVAYSGDAPEHWAGLLGQITVTTTTDTLDGDANCNNLADLAANPGADGEISLREAIKAANNDPDADTIFLQGDRYTITEFGTDDDTGDYDIREDLSIIGVSPSSTIIDGDNNTSVFDVHDDAAITVSFSNLKIQNANTGIFGEERGAALYIEGSANTLDVFLNNVWFSGNTATFSMGQGGAIYNAGNLTIANTLIEGNSADIGGGIYNAGTGTLNITNVTLSGNNANMAEGGGLYNVGTATLRNVTIAFNNSTTQGGGIFNNDTLDIGNSIVSNNVAGGSGPDAFGTLASSGSNIFGNDATASGFHGTDQRNVDPLLGVLADNGGDLMTHAPSAAQAIDTADATLTPAIDQRGFLRSDGSPDIGAHEVGASSTPATADLWLSTEDVVVGGGQTGDDSWNPSDLIGIADPQLNLGPGTTQGTFATVFDANGFSIGWDLNAATYVTAPIQIGSSNFQLLAGDLLLSPKYNGTIFTSNNAVALDTGFQASVTANNADLVVFRPDTVGDYTQGQFGLLLEDVAGGHWLQGITLIEQNITVGGYALQAGNFLYSRSGPSGDHSIWLYETGTTGTGATPVSRQEFLDGDDAGVGIWYPIHGIELLETTTEIGGQVLDAGTLLVNVDNAETVGSNGLSVDRLDVFALKVSTSSLVGAGQATAQMLFNGSHVAFDSNEEDIDAVMLGPTGAAPVGNDPVFQNAGPFNVDEGASVGTTVGDIDANDGDGGAADAGIAYSITGNLDPDGDLNDAFAIDPNTGIITVNDADDLDYEAASSMAITVEADDGVNTETTDVTINIDDVAPTLSVSGAATIKEGELYTLNLSAVEPGTNAISSWTIDWGDGTTETIAGNPSTVTHTYTNAGFTNNILVSATDSGGTTHRVGELISTSLWNDSIYWFDAITGTVNHVEDVSVQGGNNPVDVQVGPDGEVYVTGFASNNILRYNADGSFDTIFADAADGLNWPSRIAFGPDGNLYVTNMNTNEVLRFSGVDGTSTGTAMGAFISTGLSQPDGITFGPDGDLYVANMGTGNVLRFDGVTGVQDPTFLADGPSGSPGYMDIHFGPDGRLWVTNQFSDDIRRYSSIDGAFYDIFANTGATDFAGIAFGADGFVYLSDAMAEDKIIRYPVGDGSAPEPFVLSGTGGLDQPVNIVFTPAHQVTVMANQAPTAVAGGSYTINEGDDLVLDASGSTDADGTIVEYKWDLDNDLTYGDVTTVSATPTIDWATIAGWGLNDGDVGGKDYTIGLQVVDNLGATHETTAVVAVHNVAPTLSVTGAGVAGAGVPYTLNLSANDPGDDAITSWTINWGDGTIETIPGNPSSATHIYSNSGFTNNILVSAIDEDSTVNYIHNDLFAGHYINDAGVYRIQGDWGAPPVEFANEGTLDKTIQPIIGPDGNLYVSGESSRNVLRYNTETGGFIDVFANIPGEAGGIAFGPDGNLYVADYTNGEILRFNGSDGSAMGAFATGIGGKPYGLTFGPDGNLYVALYDNAEVLKYDGLSGTALGIFVSAGAGGLGTPEQIVFGPDGNLYLADVANNSVLRFNGADGTPMGDFVADSEPHLDKPNGLAFGPDGNLYVSDSQDGVILRFDGSTGVFIDEYAAGLDKPSLLAFVPDLQVHVTANAPPTFSSFIGPVTSGNEDSEITVTFGDLAVQGDENDADGTVDAFVVKAVTSGTLRIGADAGSATDWVAGSNDTLNATTHAYWTPDPNANGTLNAFEVVAEDNDGAESSTNVTVQVTVNPVNDDQVLAANTGTTVAEGSTGTTITNTMLATTDVDNTPAQLVYTLSGVPANGTLKLSGVALAVLDSFTQDDIDTGRVTYDQDGSETLSDSFAFSVDDGAGAATNSTFSITITPVNDAPVAVDDSASTNEDTPVTVNVVSNDTDIEGDPLTVSAVTQGTNGTVTFAGGSVTYTPNANFSGPDSFTYTVSDGNGGTDTATVDVITVNPINDAPVAADDSASTNEDTPETVNVVSNDTDVEGDPLTVSAVTQGTNGAVSFAGGSVTYTPNADFSGTDSFTYTVSDGNGGTDTATVDVMVNPVNDAPVAVDDSASTNEDTPVTVNVVSNDTDIEGDPLTVSAVTQGTNGTVTFAGGSVTYTPNANFSGSDSFTYTVSDGNGGTDTATVDVTVSPVNDPGTVTIDNLTPAQGDTLTANVTDVDGAAGAITYQWFRDGVAIGGATGKTYFVVQADVGTVITVTADYTDDLSSVESLTSGPTEPVTNVNDPGVVAIDNLTPVQGDTLTASVSDVEGASGAINYQWYRDGVAITGATGVSYTTVPADEGAVITVTADYIDDQGSVENLTSAGTAAVVHVNVAPTASNLNAAETYTEDIPLDLTDIVVTDVDSATVTVTLTLTDPAAGSLNAGTSGAVTATYSAGVWTASGPIADVNALLAGVVFTPSPNYDGSFAIAVSVDDGVAAPIDGVKIVTGTPVGDTPQVGSITTPASVQSGQIVIDRNADDGAEVTHFRIANITNGTLYLADGITPIHDGDTITVAQGQAGVRFTPAADILSQGSFTVESSEDGVSVAQQSGAAISVITVIPPPTSPTVTIPASSGDTAGSEPDTAPEASEPAAEPEAVPEEDVPKAVAPPVNRGPAEESVPQHRGLTSAPMPVLAQAVRYVSLMRATGVDLRDIAERLSGYMGPSQKAAAADSGPQRADIQAGVHNLMSARAYLNMVNSLDAVKKEMADDNQLNRVYLGSAIVSSVGLSVGYVVWLIRGGLLLSSLLSSLPAWQILDPLPILARKKGDDQSEDDESLESILDRKPRNPKPRKEPADASSDAEEKKR